MNEKRCRTCGFRIRGAGHEDGPHHSRGKIGVAPDESPIMSMGRGGRKGDTRTPAKKAHPGADFSLIKQGGRR